MALRRAMKESQPIDLTVSIVSADNLDLLLPCLESVFKNTHHTTLEVYLVDNASTDDTATVVTQKFPQVKVIHNSQRLGFSTNNNLVLCQGQGRYLLLLNDDTLVVDGALDTLVAFADTHPEIGVVGSFLLNPDLSFQPAFSRFPSPWIEGFWSTSAFFPRLRSKATTPFEVDTVCGAALIIRRETMEQVGLLDTQFDPIYAEETDWCYRVKKAGWKVYTHPKAQIVHYGGQTMNRTPEHKLELLQGHKVLFFRKHYSKLAAPFFKIVLWVSSFLKALIYMTVWWKSEYTQHAKLKWHIFKRALFL